MRGDLQITVYSPHVHDLRLGEFVTGEVRKETILFYVHFHSKCLRKAFSSFSSLDLENGFRN